MDRRTRFPFLHPAVASSRIGLSSWHPSGERRGRAELILVAFLFGVLRVPVAVLQLAEVLAANGPTWYLLFQGLLGLAQFAIGLAMVAGYRRAGAWGAY